MVIEEARRFSLLPCEDKTVDSYLTSYATVIAITPTIAPYATVIAITLYAMVIVIPYEKVIAITPTIAPYATVIAITLTIAPYATVIAITKTIASYATFLAGFPLEPHSHTQVMFYFCNVTGHFLHLSVLRMRGVMIYSQDASLVEISIFNKLIRRDL